MTRRRWKEMRIWLVSLMMVFLDWGASGQGGMLVVTESARQIPAAYQVDVVVVGGSTGAVAAAVEAARQGAKVFLAAPYPYLGEDMTATLRLWLEEGETPASPLGKKLFEGGNPARPLHIKRTLDDALLEAGVQFLYSCYATDILRDGGGNPCGVAMANRAGRQAVIAKVTVDATDRAWVARLSGAKFKRFPTGVNTVKRVVIGGAARSGANMSLRSIPPGFEFKGKKYDIFEYTLRVPITGAGHSFWAAAEQRARDMTYHPDQQFASDVLFQIPPDPMMGEKSGSGVWPGAERAEMRAFLPAGVPWFFVLSGCADIPRSQAEKLLRPLNLIDMGTRIGAAAAAEARLLPAPQGVNVPGVPGKPLAEGDVYEVLTGVRPTQRLDTVPQGARTLPLLGGFDVVVIGGGTSGAPAGIGAARQGARTLVVEYLHGLGGVGTLGAISKYYWGDRVGFTAEVAGGGDWPIEQKAEWWRTTLRKAGADIWFGTLGCGAFADKGRVVGAVVATPQGRGVVLGKVVIDATGNADVAAAAGAACTYTDWTDIAVQGTGLPPRELGASYTNTDFTIVDETDMVDVWNVLVYAKSKYGATTFDMGQLIDTRERRRIVGDFTVSILDQVNGRTYPDTIARSHTNYDTHGYTVHPYFALGHPEPLYPCLPYRCLLPMGLDGILVTGLGVSAHRDAIPFIRMQPDVQNQGYAAGVAAAMAASDNVGTRDIDVRTLQKHLVEIGNLPESVLKERDSYPISATKIAEAVGNAKENYRDVAILLAHPKRAMPLLRKAYAAASEKDKLTYGHILAVMGDASGLSTLMSAVESASDWDKGWNYKAMGQFGSNMSRLDSLIYAMGRTGDRRALAPILAKLKLLDADKEFSHHRAVALALEAIGDPSAAGPLVELLGKPGMSGNAMQSVEEAKRRHTASPGGLNALEPRRASLREIMLARALFRCGDKDDIGKKILQEYEKDLRGHFARHAQAVLLMGVLKKPTE
jgi:hypothetical protein